MNTDKEINEHPAIERLDAYHAEQLNDQEREEIDLHLRDCEECLGMVVMAGLAEEQEVDPKVVDFAQRVSLKELNERIEKESAGLGNRVVTDRVATKKGSGFQRLTHVAAMFLIVPLSVLTFHFYSLNRDYIEPALVAQIAADPPARRGRPGTTPQPSGNEVFRVAAEMESFNLTLEIGSPEVVYRVELNKLNGREKTIWSMNDVVGDDLGYASLTLSRRFVDKGDYRIRIWPEDAEDGAPPSREYDLEIQ